MQFTFAKNKIFTWKLFRAPARCSFVLAALCVWLAEWICPCLETQDFAIFGSQKKFCTPEFWKKFYTLGKIYTPKKCKKTFHKKFCKKILHPWKNAKFCTPEKNAKKFAPLKKCKKIFWTPEKMQKILHPWKYAKTYTTTQTPTNSIQNPTKIKGRKIPELPPYEPEKAFEIPLQNQHFSKTRHQRSSSNRQQKQRTEKVGKKSPLDQLLHPLEFFSRFFGKR